MAKRPTTLVGVPTKAASNPVILLSSGIEILSVVSAAAIKREVRDSMEGALPSSAAPARHYEGSSTPLPPSRKPAPTRPPLYNLAPARSGQLSCHNDLRSWPRRRSKKPLDRLSIAPALAGLRRWRRHRDTSESDPSLPATSAVHLHGRHDVIMSLNRVASLETFNFVPAERGSRRGSDASLRSRKLSFNPLPGDWEAVAEENVGPPIAAFEVPEWKRICESGETMLPLESRLGSGKRCP
jgi:hypothetical protein